MKSIVEHVSIPSSSGRLFESMSPALVTARRCMSQSLLHQGGSSRDTSCCACGPGGMSRSQSLLHQGGSSSLGEPACSLAYGGEGLNPFFIRAALRVVHLVSDPARSTPDMSQSLLHQGGSSRPTVKRVKKMAEILGGLNPFFIRAALRGGVVDEIANCKPGTWEHVSIPSSSGRLFEEQCDRAQAAEQPEQCLNPFFIRAALRDQMRALAMLAGNGGLNPFFIRAALRGAWHVRPANRFASQGLNPFFIRAALRARPLLPDGRPRLPPLRVSIPSSSGRLFEGYWCW